MLHQVGVSFGWTIVLCSCALPDEWPVRLETSKSLCINPLTLNGSYRGRTAPLTSEIAFDIFTQQIQVLNILNVVYTLRFFPLQNAVCFIILTYLVPVLFTFNMQGVMKLKKNSGAKRLKHYCNYNGVCVFVGHVVTKRIKQLLIEFHVLLLFRVRKLDSWPQCTGRGPAFVAVRILT